MFLNLSKGHVRVDVANIFVALFITSFASAAFSCVDMVKENRVPSMDYMDEFHNLTTLSMVNVFSELLKFKVGFVLVY
ncbi:MAG: hypothetical protein IT265_00435 [Saprospiraceae bacterium]|nr:hypothetical protein [Saprospiraceae bacterium]